MRFSLRWLFAVMTYVALVAAAWATGKGWLTDLVWGVAIVVLCYAIVVSCIATARRRAAAVGFVVFMTANLLVWLFFTNSTPVTLAVRAAGYFVGSGGVVYQPDTANPGSVRTAIGLTATLGIANAVGTLVAGFIGCLIGRLAFQNSVKSVPNRRGE